VRPNEFQALRIKVTLHVESRNHRPVSVAVVIQPSCSQDLEERFPNCLAAHVARDSISERQPEFRLSAPTGQEPIKTVALTVDADRDSDRSLRNDTALRKLLFVHTVLPDQSCPRARRKLGPTYCFQKLESDSNRRLQEQSSRFCIPRSKFPNESAARLKPSSENFCGAD
jgi:hypothetical protein